MFSYDVFLSQTHGGASRLFVGLHRGLLSLGVRSRICSGLHVNSYLARQPGVAGVRVPGPGPVTWRRACRICNAAFDRAAVAVARPSLYHLTYFPRRTRVGGAVPVAVTVLDMIHELYPEQFPADDPTSARKRHWVNAADVVFAISQQTKHDLVERFDIPAEKVVVVYPGLSPLTADPNADVARFGDYLLYVGDRIQPYKNFGALLAALARSEVARTVNLVCFGRTPLAPREQAVLQERGMLARTHVVHGSDGLLAALYAGARALVYPSTYEGFGFPPLEAMRLGCAVACSRGGSIPEVVGDAAVLFDPGDVDDMAAAIDRIVTDEALRARLLAAGKQRAAQFTWARAASETLEGYLRV
jgi:glycosyltransferase involved in cell wall biosynthesis